MIRAANLLQVARRVDGLAGRATVAPDWAQVAARVRTSRFTSRQSAIVAADILGENPEPAEYRAVPRATFTDPEVGAVGISEADAKAAGRDVMVVVKQVSATFRGWATVPIMRELLSW